MIPGQSLAAGAAGIALMHLETGNQDAARAALDNAVAAGASIADGASLFYGAPAMAFVLASADPAHDALASARATAEAGTDMVTRRRLNAAYLRMERGERPHYWEYDLIGGLTGLGVVLRRTGNTALLRDVLAYLVRLTDQIDGLPGWWCAGGPNRNEPGPPGGHSNHGMAHGIAGPLALLSHAMSDGVTVDGQTLAITRICRWLDTWQQEDPSGTWWPQWATREDLRWVIPAQRTPLRPSWCYGTPGIARAQQLAGRALGDTARQRLAEQAFTECVSDPAQIARLTTSGLCHGTAGVLATGRRIAQDAEAQVPVELLLRMHRAAGTESAGFLDGRAGAVLASGTANAWDACLLLS